ncbi:MAG: DPP IV N-terminal domain-containing protein [Flavobacteriales bacterium]
MKHILLYLFLSFSLVSFSQLPTGPFTKEELKEEKSTLKELTLKDAVLAYRKGLYPSGISALRWIDGTDDYLYYEKKAYHIKDAATQTEKLTMDTTFFQKDFPGLPSVPRISQINSKVMVINQRNKTIIYTYAGENKGNKVYINTPEGAVNKSFNMKAQAVAYTLDNNLYLATAKKSKIPIVENEDKNIVTGQAIHRFEFGISKGIFWSPDGNYIAFYQKDETDVADYPLLDINSTPGKVNSIKYPMAGQKSEYGKVGVYNLKKGRTSFLGLIKRKFYLNTGGEKDDHYLTNVTWGPNEEKIYIAEVNRAQNHMWFNEYSVKGKSKIRTIFEEKHDKWVEPENPGFFPTKDANTMLWMSEKNGFMNLYKVNMKDGNWTPLTNFNFPITSFMGINDAGTYAYVQATGKDGREKHIYSVSLKELDVTHFTSQEGTHNGQVSSSGNYILDVYSNITTPKVTQLINTESGSFMVLKDSKNRLEGHQTATMELGELTSKSGEKLYTRMIKPHDFDPSKKYPVLIYVYGGPHAQMITNSWLGGARLWMHWMANQGYIIYTLDGRGSANRGFNFENQIHRQIGEVEMEDQLTGVEYLKSLPYVDSKRLAVHGWSYGGFMTTSLMLRHPGVFTTAVAGGPVIDWKWYEIMYGERYMDSPQDNPEGYKKNSLMQYVKNLDGKLLTIHGTVDDVVVMQHNLALVQQAVKDGVQMDFFPYPMHPHNVRGKDRVHLMTKVLNYVIENNK